MPPQLPAQPRRKQPRQPPLLLQVPTAPQQLPQRLPGRLAAASSLEAHQTHQARVLSASRGCQQQIWTGLQRP